MTTKNLSVKLMEAYLDYVSQSIRDYQEEQQIKTLTELSERLVSDKRCLHNWLAQKRAVPFLKYHDLVWTIENETIAITTTELNKETWLSLQKAKLKNYLCWFVQDYQNQEDKSLREIAKETNSSISTVIEMVSGKIIPTPRTVFGILGKVGLRRGVALEAILDSIIYITAETTGNKQNNILSTKENSVSEYKPNRLEDTSSSDEKSQFKDCLDLLAKLTKHFSHATSDQRDKLRKTIGKDYYLEQYAVILMETRQMLRSEKHYREWIDMQNMLKANGG